MSRENAEVVNATWEAWSRGDLDALMERLDPAVEWDTTSFEGWPEDAVYYVHVGVRRILEEWLASWERFEAGVDRYLDLGGDRVLVLCWQRGSGRGSHFPVQMDWALLYTLKRGLICRMQAYSDRREALEAAGQRE